MLLSLQENQDEYYCCSCGSLKQLSFFSSFDAENYNFNNPSLKYKLISKEYLRVIKVRKFNTFQLSVKISILIMVS